MTEPSTAPTPPSPLPSPASTKAPAPTLRRLFWAAALLALVFVVGFVVYSWAADRLTSSQTDDAFVEAHIVNIAPEMVSGHIVRFRVEENDPVKQGDVLAEIDPTYYQDQVAVARSQLDAAQAELERQQAALDRLKDEVPLQIAIAQATLASAKAEHKKSEESQRLTKDEVDKTIDQAKAALAAARADQTLAQIEYDRYTNLFKTDAATKQRAQQAERARDSADAQVNLAIAKLALAEAERRKNDVAERDVEAALTTTQKAGKNVDLARTGNDQIHETELLTAVKKVSVESARRALKQAEDQLKYTRILAPFPGVVVKRYRHLGDFASPGVAVLSMYNPDLLYVTANLEEDRLPGVAPGNPVRIDVDAIRGPFKGRVVWIKKSTGAEFALMPRNVVSGEFTRVVQRVPVRIWIERDERWPLLRAGLSVRVTITHGEGDSAWAEQAARDMADLESRYNQPQPANPPPAPGDPQ
jgi:membrane fusion protein (multidrug efflux system)